MNCTIQHRGIFVLFFQIIFLSATSYAQTKSLSHKKVTILPATFLDMVDTNKLNQQSEKLKLIGTYKKEIGRDVQYKFYMPLMLNQQNYSAFFRGVDTINLLLEQGKFNLEKQDTTRYQRLAQELQSDAFILLQLKEITTNYPGTNHSIIENLLIPTPGVGGRIFDSYNISQALNNYTVTLILTAKIIDGSTGAVLWIESTSATNMYYHDAVNKMSEYLINKLPYKLKKRG
jgi:hypothetical protein